VLLGDACLQPFGLKSLVGGDLAPAAGVRGDAGHEVGVRFAGKVLGGK
jgi:hypothetical protein